MKRRWRVKGQLPELLVEIGEDPAGARVAAGGEAAEGEEADPQEGAGALAALLREARNVPRGEAERAFVEIYTHLFGAMPPDWEWAREDVGRRRQLFDRISGPMERAASAGMLRVGDERMRSTVVSLPGQAEEPLGPASTQEGAPESKSWVGMVLMDQDGNPVPNRPYRVVAPDGSVQEGTLDSNGSAILKDLDPGSCKISCPYVEPHPELSHTVQPGEHISGIAQSYGFDDYTLVWNHPDNAEVQSVRQDPHVLQPGDVLAIPEAQDSPADKPTGAKHTFTLQVSPLKLRLKLLDLAANPVSGASVTVGGQALTTGGDGVIEAPVDKGASDESMDVGNTNVDLLLGGLNPSDDDSDAGWKARLFNLGFLWDPTVDDTDDEMLVALQDFQAQYGLQVSGQLDDATKARLLQVYGA